MMPTLPTQTPRSLPPLPPLPISSTDPSIQISYKFRSTAHWIIPNILMQGGRPQVDHAVPQETQVGPLVTDAKCTTFVCLQAECQPVADAILLSDGGCKIWLDPEMRADLPDYSGDVRKIEREILHRSQSPPPRVSFLHYGIGDMEAASSLASLSEVVRDLASRILHDGEVLYIHCWGGKGRSGMVCACLLGVLYPDMEAEQALAYIDGLIQSRTGGDVRLHSPETEEQKETIREFFRSYRSVCFDRVKKWNKSNWRDATIQSYFIHSTPMLGISELWTVLSRSWCVWHPVSDEVAVLPYVLKSGCSRFCSMRFHELRNWFHCGVFIFHIVQVFVFSLIPP